MKVSAMHWSVRLCLCYASQLHRFALLDFMFACSFRGVAGVSAIQRVLFRFRPWKHPQAFHEQQQS